MILGNNLLKKITRKCIRVAKEAVISNSFCHKCTTVKYFSNVRNLGRQVYRDKKVGECQQLPKNVKEKYKSNFENILMTIMNNKSEISAGKSKFIEKNENESEIEIEMTKNQNQNLSTPIPIDKSNTSEESCEDIYERAERFKKSFLNGDKNDLSKVLLISQYRNEPVILKKNSLFTIGEKLDEFTNSELSCSDSEDEAAEPEKEYNLVIEKL